MLRRFALATCCPPNLFAACAHATPSSDADSLAALTTTRNDSTRARRERQPKAQRPRARVEMALGFLKCRPAALNAAQVAQGPL
ncbi:MAG TPA: hypothetical protein VFS67_11030 [Polyangiaceae bacterium]|nr:hypothetical protein [Polyangiaceae bacterium]